MKNNFLILSEATMPYFVGGGEIFLDNFTEYLVKDGRRVKVLSNRIHEDEASSEIRKGAEYLRVGPVIHPPSYFGWPSKLGLIKMGYNKIVREARKYGALKKIELDFKPELIILNGVTIPPLHHWLRFGADMKAWRFYSRQTNKPTLFIVHAINPPNGSTLRNVLHDAMNSDAVVVVEEWMQELLRRIMDNRKPIYYIPNGVNTELFKYSDIATENSILYVGRLSEDHGLPILLQALRKIKNEKMTFKCYIVGSGPDSQAYKAIASKMGLNEAIFLGPKTQAEIAKLYESVTFVVNPINVDAIGIATLEAMSSGRPVIKSSPTGKDKIIKNGVNGFLFKMGDAEQLAEKIEYCLANPEQVKKCGQEARKTILKQYSLESCFSRYKEIIDKL